MGMFNWFKSSEKVTAVTDPLKQQGYLALSRLMREHILVRVKIDGIDRHYQSMVLAVNANDSMVLMDELFPRDGALEGLDGQWVTVFASQGSMTTRFTSFVLGSEKDADGVLHKLSFPELVEQDQRRSAFRLAVGEAVSIEAVVQTPAKQAVHAKVIDISSYGVRLAIEGLEDPAVKNGVVLEKLNLLFGREGSIHCDLDVRSARQVGSEEGYLLLGGRFVGLPESQRAKLDRFLIRTQRQLRRRELQVA